MEDTVTTTARKLTPWEYFGREEFNEDGYEFRPNTTQVPNEFLDFFMVALDEDELRVMLYLFRHTLGYKDKKKGDFIALVQFVKGIDGQDFGCGVRGTSYDSKEKRVRNALAKLIDKKLVKITKGLKINPEDKHSTNMYELNMKTIKSVSENVT